MKNSIKIEVGQYYRYIDKESGNYNDILYIFNKVDENKFWGGFVYKAKNITKNKHYNRWLLYPENLKILKAYNTPLWKLLNEI